MLYHEEDYGEAESMSSTAPVLNIANADEEDIMLRESEGETSFYNFVYPTQFPLFQIPMEKKAMILPGMMFPWVLMSSSLTVRLIMTTMETRQILAMQDMTPEAWLFMPEPR